MPRALSWLIVWSLAAPGLTAQAADDPRVDFAKDVKPILHDRCVKCHAGTQKKGALSINTREALLAGGESGAAIVPGKPGESELIRRIISDDAGLRMPSEGKPLTEKQIATLKAWVAQGAEWETGFAFAREVRRAPLPPRRPELPPADGRITHPIDRMLQPYSAKHQVKDAAPVSDRVFLRRVSLDLVGLLPSPEELDAFEKEVTPDKRPRKVESLLSNRRQYADHWLTFWNDALRNAYRGTGFIDGGRRQISSWLYRALYENKPYDRFVHELISPKPGSGADGFTWGILWRGVVNESQRREIQNAQNVSQVFLGTNLKCASCHDSFVNAWKLTDAYALASVFSEGGPLEIHRCDKPTGEQSTVGFLYPEVGNIDASAPKPARMEQLANLMVDPKNGRLARTIVNRLWARLMGRGLVEPVDDMDIEPWHQDLLDYLATDLVDHHYDLKRTLTLIATSQAYQRPSLGVPPQGHAEEYVFRGPYVKRMTAEQFVDAAQTLTGVWPRIDADLVTVDGRGQGGQLLAVADVLRSDDQPRPTARAAEKRLIDRFVEARWIWSHEKPLTSPGGEALFARKTRKLDTRPAHALALFTADNSVDLMINGKKVATNTNWEKPVLVDITASLADGENVIAFHATNGGSGPNPAGLIAVVGGFDAAGKLVWSDLTDASWSSSPTAAAGWDKSGFDASAWKAAVAFAGSREGPWGIAARVQATAPSAAGDVATILGDTPIRASLMPLDALQSSLGRPSREQVVTIRETRASMLQALELSNGSSLDTLLKSGATRLLTDAQGGRSASKDDSVLDFLYRTAFGRRPTDAERTLADNLTGTPATAEGLADLLWTLVLSPEFQLIE